MSAPETETKPTLVRRCCGGRLTWLVILIGGIVIGVTSMSLWPEQSDAQSMRGDITPIIGETGAGDQAELTPDERMTALIVGQWKMERDGRRDLTVNEDGTAVMKVTITSLYQYVFGSKMTFDIEWEIRDGMLHFITTGGTPKTSVDLVTKAYGKERAQPILELTQDRMLLKDAEEGEPDHDWKRVP